MRPTAVFAAVLIIATSVNGAAQQSQTMDCAGTAGINWVMALRPDGAHCYMGRGQGSEHPVPALGAGEGPFVPSGNQLKFVCQRRPFELNVGVAEITGKMQGFGQTTPPVDLRLVCKPVAGG
jgi:hypothetical protein